MTEKAASKWRWTELLVAVFLPGAGLGALMWQLATRFSIPEEIVIRWGLDGQPGMTVSKQVAGALLILSWLALWVPLLVLRRGSLNLPSRRRPLTTRERFMTAYGALALIGVAATLTAAENDDGDSSASVVRLLLVPLAAACIGAVIGAAGAAWLRANENR